MRGGTIIFSRLSSKRLPEKALVDISGRSLLGRVIDITKNIVGIDEIILATSTDPQDDKLEEIALHENIEVFRGSLNDVCLRSIKTCERFKLDYFVRICGDRPFFNAKLISELLLVFKKNLDIDLLTTSFPRTVPPGLTCEIIKIDALQKAYKNIKEEEDFEHLTSFFYKNKNDFNIKNYQPNDLLDFDNINLCVDNLDDLKRARWISNEMDKIKGSYDNITTIISVAKKWKIFNK